MGPLDYLLLRMMTKNGTYSPYGMYPAHINENGMQETTLTTGVSDDTGEYVVPGVKNGKRVDPYDEFRRSGEYFAKFPNNIIGRALSNKAADLIHKWQEQNNKKKLY